MVRRQHLLTLLGDEWLERKREHRVGRARRPLPD
jgi:hypothetical protein